MHVYYDICCVLICIYIYIYIYDLFNRAGGRALAEALHSAKGGAVETGCSGLHYIIGCLTI